MTACWQHVDTVTGSWKILDWNLTWVSTWPFHWIFPSGKLACLTFWHAWNAACAKLIFCSFFWLHHDERLPLVQCKCMHFNLLKRVNSLHPAVMFVLKSCRTSFFSHWTLVHSQKILGEMFKLLRSKTCPQLPLREDFKHKMIWCNIKSLVHSSDLQFVINKLACLIVNSSFLITSLQHAKWVLLRSDKMAGKKWPNLKFKAFICRYGWCCRCKPQPWEILLKRLV